VLLYFCLSSLFVISCWHYAIFGINFVSLYISLIIMMFQSLLSFTTSSSSLVVQGSYAGNALGFRVTSLTKLVDTRSNKPRLTLLHFLVDEVCRKNDDAVKFVDDLSQTLTVAARYVTERNRFELVSITVVVVRRAWLLFGWVTVFRR